MNKPVIERKVRNKRRCKYYEEHRYPGGHYTHTWGECLCPDSHYDGCAGVCQYYEEMSDVLL